MNTLVDNSDIDVIAPNQRIVRKSKNRFIFLIQNLFVLQHVRFSALRIYEFVYVHVIDCCWYPRDKCKILKIRLFITF